MTWLKMSAALALLAGAASAQQDRNAFILQPTRVDADKAFSLAVVSYRYNCGATYSHERVSRNGSRIDLRFLATENPAAVCPLIDKPYGPEFALGALPAGRYEVHAIPLLPCHVAQNPCDAPEKPERVGVLTVGAEAQADWFIQPATVQAGKDFTLRILSERYGNCRTNFNHSSQAAHNGTIVATFTIETNPAIDCIVDIHPHGPAFEMKGLPAGRYPVAVVEMPACAYFPEPCPMIPPVARVVDTLVVTGPTGLESPARPASGTGSGRLSARMAGGLLHVSVNRGGSWRSELADLQGRTLRVMEPGKE